MKSNAVWFVFWQDVVMEIKKYLKLCGIFVLFFAVLQNVQAGNILAYDTTLVTTAYYSPSPDQNFYVRGSFEADKILNGNGTNGADGTEVFFGMLAAPSNYPFGTKIWIEGLGLGAVHDRGGAIVARGNKRYRHSYDRLDIWMGPGDAGLARALGWGKRTRKARVFLPGAVVPEKYQQKIVSSEFMKHTPVIAMRPRDGGKSYAVALPYLYRGMKGKNVRKLQNYLSELGYFEEKIDGKFGKSTAKAVIALQMKEGLIKGLWDKAAGYFGNKTLKKLGFRWAVLQQAKAEDKFKKDMEQWVLEELFRGGMTLGDEGFAVKKLKKVLRDLGHLSLADEEMTENYDLLTAEAVYAFQRSVGLSTSRTDPWAGILGTKTTSELMAVLSGSGNKKTDEVVLGNGYFGRWR